MAAPNLTPLGVTTIRGKTARYAATTSLAAALSNSAASNKVFKINSVYCANIDGASGADITLTIFNGTTDFAIASTIAVPADATQVLVTRDAYIYLEEGDSLRAQASANGDLVLVIGYEEIS
jgi:hypothetical protein